MTFSVISKSIAHVDPRAESGSPYRYAEYREAVGGDIREGDSNAAQALADRQARMREALKNMSSHYAFSNQGSYFIRGQNGYTRASITTV